MATAATRWGWKLGHGGTTPATRQRPPATGHAQHCSALLGTARDTPAPSSTAQATAWITTAQLRPPRHCMALHGSLWNHRGHCSTSWATRAPHGPPWHCMAPHKPLWHHMLCTGHYSPTQAPMAVHGPPWHCLTPHGPPQSCVAPHGHCGTARLYELCSGSALQTSRGVQMSLASVTRCDLGTRLCCTPGTGSLGTSSAGHNSTPVLPEGTRNGLSAGAEHGF